MRSHQLQDRDLASQHVDLDLGRARAPRLRARVPDVVPETDHEATLDERTRHLFGSRVQLHRRVLVDLAGGLVEDRVHIGLRIEVRREVSARGCARLAGEQRAKVDTPLASDDRAAAQSKRVGRDAE